MAFQPRLTELALPSVVCRYMDDVFLAVAYQDNKQLEQATKLAMYIAAEGTGYPHPLVLNLEPEGTQRFLELSVAAVGNRIVISFYNKVAQDWKQDQSYIQMRLLSPYSTVTSQQQVDRVKGTVQRMLEVDLEETEMWLALCELDIECYVSSYNPKYIAQALSSLISQPKLTRKTKEMMRKLSGRMGLEARECCGFTALGVVYISP